MNIIEKIENLVGLEYLNNNSESYFFIVSDDQLQKPNSNAIILDNLINHE